MARMHSKLRLTVAVVTPLPSNLSRKAKASVRVYADISLSPAIAMTSPATRWVNTMNLLSSSLPFIVQ